MWYFKEGYDDVEGTPYQDKFFFDIFYAKSFAVFLKQAHGENIVEKGDNASVFL